MTAAFPYGVLNTVSPEKNHSRVLITFPGNVELHHQWHEPPKGQLNLSEAAFRQLLINNIHKKLQKLMVG